jgi:hypothetical protein
LFSRWLLSAGRGRRQVLLFPTNPLLPVPGKTSWQRRGHGTISLPIMVGLLLFAPRVSWSPGVGGAILDLLPRPRGVHPTFLERVRFCLGIEQPRFLRQNVPREPRVLKLLASRKTQQAILPVRPFVVSSASSVSETRIPKNSIKRDGSLPRGYRAAGRRQAAAPLGSTALPPTTRTSPWPARNRRSAGPGETTWRAGRRCRA